LDGFRTDLRTFMQKLDELTGAPSAA